MASSKFLIVTVRNPEKLLFEGRCSSVSATNPKGEFDVLPQHTRFITLISGILYLNVHEGSSMQIEFESGVLRCLDDVVNIYLGLESVSK